MTQQHFAILLGGAVEPTDRLRAQLAGCRTIAADGGMRHALALGLTPELWVGDFDSTDQTLINEWPQVVRQPYPAAKNETDGEIAVGEAKARGATSLTLVGALGGERTDHALAHLLMSLRLAEDGWSVMLTSGTEEAYPILPGQHTIDLPDGSLFSVPGLTALDALTLGNVAYPLTRFDLAFGSSRTISNIACGPVRVSLEAGRAVLLARPHDFSGH